MSAGINEARIGGNAGRDAELRYSAKGTAWATFSVACSRWLRDQGDPARGTEYTDWINVIAWGELAENASGTVLKGVPVEVTGRISTRSWENERGERQFRTEVVAASISVNGVPVPSRSVSQSHSQRPSRQAPAGGEPFEDDAPMYETATGRPVRRGEVDPDDLPFE